ncbi:hypothetical protein [Prosthecobacter sp.]|uniref:hypothetical protein n=1 Tax=Prosthecobacter sp. TaxID=1965333 RepID=UPI001DB49495|nr:hypothetical protein [Prosthecobacter sp.]MCB1278521.1 hypothetical protein [Prosthecobacter sp.]
MSPAELQALKDPSGLSPEAHALWHVKNGDWDSAHNIAQDIHTKMGSWIHALLHVIEGDQWNADYWFSKAGKPSHGPKEIDKLWDEIAAVVLS